jgi:glyoxylase I family protein
MPQPSVKVTGIAVIFTVQSLERTLRFYAETLGLPMRQEEGYLLCKLASGTELLFFEGEATPGSSPQIVFGLDEGGIDSAAELLAERGVQLLTPVSEAPGGWSVELKDPDGHGLAYYQDGSLPRRL